jgi:hypothetical protein
MTIRLFRLTGKALVRNQPLIFPPRDERLGVWEHTRPACRFDRNRLTNYTAGDTRDFADAFRLAEPGGDQLYAFIDGSESLYFF